MKTITRNSTIYHFSCWVFATLLMELVCSAARGGLPDRNFEGVVNHGVIQMLLPTSISSVKITAYDAPVSPEVFGPFHGTVSGVGSFWTYRPFPDFVGTDQFKYKVRTADGRVFEGKVIITVRNGLFISDTSIFETTSGSQTATFTTSLLVPADEFNTVSVSFRTTPGTAQEGSDYIGTSGTLTFAPGVRLLSITVPVLGDLFVEPTETFFVNLFNPANSAIILDGTGVGTILDFAGSRTSVGTAALAPVNPVVEVGEPVILSLSWTHPVGWRQLETIDLLITDDEDAVMAVRWNEAENSFSLYKPDIHRFVRTARAGSSTRFESFAAAMFVEESTGGGPPGRTVTIRYGLVFKPQAAGRTFRVETFATDDAGKQQGFEQVGTVTVLPH